jgi:hypothetical protein
MHRETTLNANVKNSQKQENARFADPKRPQKCHKMTKGGQIWPPKVTIQGALQVIALS